MRTRRRGPSASILISVAVLYFTSIANAIENDFSIYPVNSQTCLYNAANKSGCQGDTLQQMNGCLCSNSGGFVTSSASCIGGTDPDDLSSVYSIMSNACSYSNTPLGFSESQFLAAGSSSAAASTATATKTSSQQKTTSAAQTTSSHPASVSVIISTVSGGSTVTVTETSPASTSSNSGSGKGTGDPGNNTSSSPSTGLIAGVAAGGAVALALIAAAIFFCLRHRRRKAASVHDEAHPMLPGAGYGPFSGGDFAMQQGASEQKWRPQSGQDWNAPPSTSPQPTNFNWETPYQSGWNNSTSPQPPPFQHRPDSMGPSQMTYHQPPPPDQSQQLLSQQQQSESMSQQAQQLAGWGNYPPPAAASQGAQGGGYGGHQPNVFELQGPETPMPGQAPAEVPSSPVKPLRGGHNYPPPTWH